MARLVFLFSLSLAFSSILKAQYHFDFWTADQGLPQNIVRDLHQTADGYLWIATLDGLARFDGVRFAIFNTGNSAGISTNRFTCLFEGDDGALWAGAENGDVTRYRAGGFNTYSTQHGLPHSLVRGITGDKAGHLWVLSGNQILSWGGARFLPVATSYFPRGSGLSFYVIQHSRRGGFWSWGHDGLSVFAQGRVTSYTQKNGLPGSNVQAVAEDQRGTLWVATDAGLARIQGSVVKVYHLRDGLPSYNMTFVSSPELKVICRDRKGMLTAIDLQSWRCEGIGRPPIDPPEFLEQSVFYEDRERNLWIGTNGQGLCRAKKQTVSMYGHWDAVRTYNVYPVFQDRADAIWMGVWPGFVSRYQNGRYTNYTKRDGLNGEAVTALYQDHSGRLWVGAYGGNNSLRVQQSERFVVPRELQDLGTVAVIYQDHNGALWFGSDRKLVRLKEGSAKAWTAADGLAGNDIRVIVEDAVGGLWIGGYGGLTYFKDGRLTCFRNRDGLPSNNVRALYLDPDGDLWIGTYDGGLGRLRKGRFTRYTVREGLFNNGVFRILEDGHGNLWMSCNQGIYRVNKRELNEFAAGKIAFITSVAYGKSDGMRNVECNGGTWPAGLRARDGRLWFPTQDGVAVIDPEGVPINRQPPPVRIETFLLDRAAVSVAHPLTIEPGHVNWEIEYTALSFIRPEHIRFRYKLEGLDPDWVWAGTRRMAYYSRVPAGTYRFRVIAANSDGVWNTEGASVQVRVLPPVYRTWWFVALALLTLGSAALSGYRYRVDELKRRQSAHETFARQLIASQEGERRRIAAELHDSLGQSLVLIRNWALLGSRQLGPRNAAREELDEITATAARAIHEVREIAYNLGPYHLDRLGLANGIGDMVQRVSKASGIPFTTELEPLDDALSREGEINLFRIAQEAVNNLVKHSGATQAIVRMRREADGVKLLISDNGKGFQITETVSSSGAHGFGLRSMKERVHLLRGAMAIRSAPGEGTTIEVTLKMAGT